MTVSETLPLNRDAVTFTAMSLEVVEGPDAGKSLLTKQERVSVGTAPTNDLVLSDSTVSRYHLDLVRQGDSVQVLDHGSTNRTQISGIVIERGLIPAGTVLQLGKTKLKVTDGETITAELLPTDRLGSLLGRSSVMRKLMASISRVAKTDASVLLIGETGSGKELVCRAIHDESTRSGGPLEIVDCGSVLPTLLASELFGHEKGAFTGAERQHIGAFERAHGGTLFLDEIGELPLQLQSALLGALERRAFRRLGGKDVIEVDVRLISATNRDLRGAVNAKSFRQDLYYRLAVVPMILPSLRQRKEDIPMLARHFVELAGYPGDPSEVLTSEVLTSFEEHDWPGNVRELRNAIEAVLAVGNVPLFRSARSGSVTQGGADPFAALNELTYHDARDALLEQFEASYLRRLLTRSDGNVSEAARISGINRTYLTRLIKKRGLRVKRVAEERD